MIKVVNVKTWTSFERIIKNLLNERQQHSIEGLGPFSIFRGQPNADWPLETTLERFTERNLDMLTYYVMIKRLEYRIKTFTGRSWDLPTYDEYAKWLRDAKFFDTLPALEYMAYLRHYGFPSPLLDWSYSPYVATYFAFRDIASTAKKVAIFVWYKYIIHEPLSSLDQPRIFQLDWDLQTDRRHYLQQSVYTICCSLGKNWPYFANHQDFSEEDRGAGYLTKYILPASERANALMSLEPYNINAYSLMGTEESLMEAEFIRLFALQKARTHMYPNAGISKWDHI
jgi:hypothetical protein